MSNSSERKKELVELYYRALMQGAQVRQTLEQFYADVYAIGREDGIDAEHDYQESR